MKKTFKSVVVVLLFISALTATIMAHPNMSFTVTNNTSFVIGTVTIYNTQGTPTTINVSGSGVFSTEISGGVSAAVINNQSIQKNGQAINITLASGFVVQVILTGNQIVITDQQIIYSPTKGKK